MEERVISRGDVYWITVDDSVGGEQQTGRPALVVSGTGAGERYGTHTVAYLTTGGYASPVTPQVMVNRLRNRVLCNQLRTLDQSRFTSYMCTLTSDEMRRVTGALAGALCIPNYPNGSVVTDDSETEDNEIDDLRVELMMYKRMYEKTLDQLVELRIETDMNKRLVVVEPPVEVVAEPEVVEEEPPKILRKEVELNTCELSDLLDIGVNEDVANRLIEGRPYKKIEDIRTVDGVTSMMYAFLSKAALVVAPVVEEKEYTWAEFKKLPESEQKSYLDYCRNELGENESCIARKMDVKPGTFSAYVIDHGLGVNNTEKKKKEPRKELSEIEPDVKLNINTVTAKDLMEKLGMLKDYAYAITRHRKRNGLFTEVEELLLVEKFSKKKYEEYKEYFTVGEAVDEPPEEPEKPEITPTPVVKYNINTASQYELQQAGFTKAQAAKIRYSRNKDGPFRELEDLLEIDGIKKKDIRKLRDVLEV